MDNAQRTTLAWLKAQRVQTRRPWEGQKHVDALLASPAPKAPSQPPRQAPPEAIVTALIG